MPVALDVDLAGSVDHDLGDAFVAQQRLERPKADDLVGDLAEHSASLGPSEGEALGVKCLGEGLLDLLSQLGVIGQVELGIELGDDPVLNLGARLDQRLALRQRRQQPEPKAAEAVSPPTFRLTAARYLSHPVPGSRPWRVIRWSASAGWPPPPMRFSSDMCPSQSV